ncbi:MAG: hypothetical protein JWM47_3753 [Acidimicrobiales bacterium]|nr:hypothetical protein [Acidimicrobiales bacterium]
MAGADAPGGAVEADEPAAQDRLTGDGSRSSRFETLREAAIQAEYATGRREETEEAARRSVLRRVGTIIVGFIVLFGGIAMMILPGPGILGVIAGLAILSQELAWAERLLEYVKKRARVEELKAQPKWVQAVMWTITAGAVIGSLVYLTFIRE